MKKKHAAPTGPERLAPPMPGDLEQRLRRQCNAAAKVLAEHAQEGETPQTADELFAEAMAAEAAKLAPPEPQKPSPVVPPEDDSEKGGK